MSKATQEHWGQLFLCPTENSPTHSPEELWDEAASEESFVGIMELQSLLEGLGMGFPNQRGSFETPDLEGTGHGLCALPRSFSVSGHGQPWSLQGKKVHTGFAQVQGLPGHPKGKLLARATADLSLVPTAGRAQQCGTVCASVGTLSARFGI